jgi:hypothetical protein
MVFKKFCPRCKRRYPPNFSACLECGSTLIDMDKEAKKAELKKYIPMLGMILLCGAVIAAVIFFILPTINYSLVSGQETGTMTKNADLSSIATTYPLNQMTGDGNLQVVMTKTREGARSANSRKFLFVTVSLQNLRSDKPIRVPASDFTLIDSSGVQYASYGIGDKIIQEIDPLASEAYELMYEIPQDATNLKIRYNFPGSTERSGSEVYFLL